MFTKIFWQRIFERMVVAFAVGFLGTSGVADLFTAGSTFDLKARASLGAVQALGILLVGIAGSQVGDKTSPSLLPSPPEPPLDAEGHVDAGHADQSAILLGLAVGIFLCVLVVLLR